MNGTISAREQCNTLTRSGDIQTVCISGIAVTVHSCRIQTWDGLIIFIEDFVFKIYSYAAHGVEVEDFDMEGIPVFTSLRY